MAIPPDLVETVQVFVQQLSQGTLREEDEIVLQCSKLLRLSALSAWSDDQSADRSKAVAAVNAVSQALLNTGYAHPCIEGISIRIAPVLHKSSSKKVAATGITNLLQYIGEARSILCDNVVTAIAGGPARRCVMILGVPQDSISVEAIVDAAAEMDALHVLIVRVLADNGAGAQAINLKFNEIDGISAEIIDVSDISIALRRSPTHAVLIDAIAFDGQRGIVARCGAAIVVAAANLAGVRTFALSLSYRMLKENSSTTQSLLRLRGHPGPVMSYACVKENGDNLRALNPLHDYVKCTCFDAIITDAGISSGSKAGLLNELEKFPIS